MRPYADLIGAVVKLAEENPEKTARPDYFHDNGRPCCIFGHAFAQLGYKRADIRAVENATEDGVEISELDLTLIGISEPTKKQRQWARRVQVTQDLRNSWSQALKSAGPVPR